MKNKGKYTLHGSNYGAYGDNAVSKGNTFKINSPDNEINYVDLSNEIKQLWIAYAQNLKSQEDITVLRNIKEAEEAAIAKDEKTVFEKLKNVGAGTLSLAKEIGVEIVASIISKQMGV